MAPIVLDRESVTHTGLAPHPERLVAEIVAGALVTRPRLTPRQAHAATRLGIKLGAPFDLGDGGPGGWLILDTPALALGESDLLVPSLAAWQRRRMPVLPDTPAFTVAPDWVCEVLSETTAQLDRELKLPLYARARIEYVWLLDPSGRTLEVLTRDDDGYRAHAQYEGDVMVFAEPFHAIGIDLGALWG